MTSASMSRRAIAEPTAKLVCTTSTLMRVMSPSGMRSAAMRPKCSASARPVHEQSLMARGASSRTSVAHPGRLARIRGKSPVRGPSLLVGMAPSRRGDGGFQPGQGGADMKIRVLVVDDFPLVREGLTASLEVDPDIEVVGEAGDGEQGLSLARELRPDVVLTDMRMPGLGGPVLLARLREEVPEARVLVVSASEKAETLLEAVSAGAAGYLT